MSAVTSTVCAGAYFTGRLSVRHEEALALINRAVKLDHPMLKPSTIPHCAVFLCCETFISVSTRSQQQAFRYTPAQHK